MEFKLNKIDTDIIKKMEEEIKDDKVHSSESIRVKKDLKEEKQEVQGKSGKDKNKKRYFSVEAVRYTNKNININAEKLEDINKENSKGRILDTTK